MRQEEQNEYRDRLVRLQTRLTEQVRESMGRMADKARTPDELSDVPTHSADRDSEGLDPEMELEATREQMLEAILHALDRVEQGNYGRCEDCGQQISRPRLDALPFAARCVACEQKRETE